MSLEAIHEADAKESEASSSSLPDFDVENMDLPVMIDNFAKYGDLTGSRDPSRERTKKIKEEKLTEDPGQNEGPWAAQQPGHQERMQEAKKKLVEALKDAERGWRKKIPQQKIPQPAAAQKIPQQSG